VTRAELPSAAATRLDSSCTLRTRLMVFRIDECGTTLPGYPQIDTTPPPVEQLDRVLIIYDNARFCCERITGISAAATVLSAVCVVR